MPQSDPDLVDVFVIGGGINGCGIARDAAGRGLSVILAEMDDLASATSSASTKLFHGGLRYLEYFELRLVREALIEREVLLRAMPHISWPLRFVLPYSRDMRFDTNTPTSRVLNVVMPWMKGRRPAWLIRLGLFLYDHLGGRRILPGTRRVDLRTDPAGAAVSSRFRTAFEYSDCWVDDSRLVVLNARDARARGARILTRTKVVSARRDDALWHVETCDMVTGDTRSYRAKMVVNAAGPWAGEVLRSQLELQSRDSVRLVRGSHIITRRLFDHDRCYFCQGTDGRIMFMIPYEDDFTLIGTTDVDHGAPDHTPTCTDDERQYMLDFVNQYLATPISATDVVSSYSGVRPLYDDGAANASAATRDYTLAVDQGGGAPVLHVFGGKITTYRRLAESAIAKIADHVPVVGAPWTAQAALPGGDFPVEGADDLARDLRRAHPFLTDQWARRLVRAYGTDAAQIMGDARCAEDLGRDFGGTLTEAEAAWMMDHEFARTAEDMLWRRSKLGLRLEADQVAALQDWIDQRGR